MAFLLKLFWKIFGGLILLILAIVLVAVLAKACISADERKSEGRSQAYLEGHINEEIMHPGTF